MIRKHGSLRKSLQNNKVVFVLSVIVAIVVWLIVAMQGGEEQQTTLRDIPVTLDTATADSLDLHMFGRSDFTVEVKVSGKRYEVSSSKLSADDFIATASTVNVTSAGKHTLPITVRTKDNRSTVEIVSFSPESLEVKFDYSITESYPVEVQISPEGQNVAADGYINGEPVVSSTEVTVTGAATEMNTISKVIAKVNLDAPLTETTKFENTGLSIINENGGIVPSLYVDIEDSLKEVTVTIPIFQITTIKPSVRFKNTPAYYVEHPVQYICSPSGMIDAAVATELLASTESLSLGTIDFSLIKAGANTFTFAAADIPNIRFLDDSIEEFRVYFSLDGLQSRTYTIFGDAITFNALPDGVAAAIDPDTQLEITVYGPPEELETLTSDRITATVDAKSLSAQTQPYTLPVAFTMEGTAGCWVSGDHTVDVTVS